MTVPWNLRFSMRSALAAAALIGALAAVPAARADTYTAAHRFGACGRFVSHETPCLAFAVEEKRHLKLGKDRLEVLGFATGAWLGELRKAALAGAPDETPIRVRWRGRSGERAVTRPLRELRHLVLGVGPGQRVGYVTDLRYTEENVQTLAGRS
jgi:ribonuclease Z